MTFKELPAVVQAKMLELQRAQQGRAKASVFERKLDSCKMEGGIDWPKEQFEAWSDALREGKTDKLVKLLSKGKRGRKPKAAETEAPKQETITKELAKRAAARGADRVYFAGELRKEATPSEATEPEKRKGLPEPVITAGIFRTSDGKLHRLDREAVKAYNEYSEAKSKRAEEELRLKRESEQVNHPEHYNATSTEVLVMMEAVWGKEAVRQFCEMHAFKYRMRAGYKGEAATDIEKALWYERRAKCL